MTGKITLLLLMLAPLVAIASTTLEEYPMGKSAAVIWTVDDMGYDYYESDPGHLNWKLWTNFWDMANLAAVNHVVFTPAVIAGRTTVTNGFPMMQAALDAGHFFPVCHSWSHPVHINDYDLQYVQSVERLNDNIDYPDQYIYRGQDYNNIFVQWGGCTNINYDLGKSILSSNNCIGIRWYAIGNDGWPTWNDDAGMFETIVGGQSIYPSTTGYLNNFSSYQTAFDDAYEAGETFWYYGHPHTDFEDVAGENAAAWTNLFDHIGNRPDVWYTNPTAWAQYRYLTAVADLGITETNAPNYKLVSVTAERSERARYGLSYPPTLRISKPSSWGTNTQYGVYARSTGDWVALPDVTTNDYFTGDNCYRDDGDDVLVSQALPQWSDQVYIKLRLTDRFSMPCFFARGSVVVEIEQ